MYQKNILLHEKRLKCLFLSLSYALDDRDKYQGTRQQNGDNERSVDAGRGGEYQEAKGCPAEGKHDALGLGQWFFHNRILSDKKMTRHRRSGSLRCLVVRIDY